MGAWPLLALCAVLCCTGCQTKRIPTLAEKNGVPCHQGADQEQEEFPSETAHLDLGKAPLTPGALKMSVGDYFKHVEEKYLSKKGLMLRIIFPPSAFKNLEEAMKASCGSMISEHDRASITTERELFDKIAAGIGQHPQYDRSTIYLRCFDEVFFPSYHLSK